VRFSTWRHPTPCWNFSVLTVGIFLFQSFLWLGHRHVVFPIYVVFSAPVGNAAFWPTSGFLASFRLSGLLQAFWPSSGFLAFFRLSGLLQAFWPSSGFLAFFRLSSLLGGLFCILRIVLSASSGWIVLSTGYIYLVLSTNSLLYGLFCPHLLSGLFCLHYLSFATLGFAALCASCFIVVFFLSTRSSLLDFSVRSFGALSRCSVLLLYRDPVAFLRRSGFCAACSLATKKGESGEVPRPRPPGGRKVRHVSYAFAFVLLAPLLSVSSRWEFDFSFLSLDSSCLIWHQYTSACFDGEIRCFYSLFEWGETALTRPLRLAFVVFSVHYLYSGLFSFLSVFAGWCLS
jgi:hypothetical protein